MGESARGSARFVVSGLFLLASMWTPSAARAQVFTVGEKTATADINTDFAPTRVTLPEGALSERGRRQLIRDFDAEQGFAHRALPMGATGLTLIANGKLTPGGSDYRHAVYEKGQAAGPGDRIVVTALEIKGDRIVVDVNGGPYVKHRFIRHIQINNAPLSNNFDERATGARVTLQFEGGVPELSAPELKALLEPVLDFGVKTSEQAYADTLPAPIKGAIASHEVLVGMDKRMVVAALGAPESKLREHGGADGSGIRYEEWIYGHVPKTIQFVRFEGDRVTLIKVAAMGQPIQIRDKTEMAAYVDPSLTREIAQGDAKGDVDHPVAPPTLRKPGEALPEEAKTNRPTQLPVDSTKGASGSSPGSVQGIPPMPETPQQTPGLPRTSTTPAVPTVNPLFAGAEQP